jgi:hypothetical protein
LVYALLLGLYLTFRGYHSLDGDQAYRLPLLLHRQDPGLYARDPFVQALDAFNPHGGSLMALDALTRPLGLSAGLFIVFVLTFIATCSGVDRLARVVWPESGSSVGWIAVGLVLAAKAGNIGTNHLFEAMVLDRLVALALGWLAFAMVVAQPARGSWPAMLAIGLATLVHPSVGLQLALVLGASWVLWGLAGRSMEVGLPTALSALLGLSVAVVPGLAINLQAKSSLLGDLPDDVFWILSVELQSPQHMMPHLWRMPQWFSWCSYMALALLQLTGSGFSKSLAGDRGPGSWGSQESWPPARRRLAGLLTIVLIGLGAAWVAIEMGHQVRVTIFQPFRMATVARGIALVIVSGRLVALWRSGDRLSRLRAILLAAGFISDWLLVVVTMAELGVSATAAIRPHTARRESWRVVEWAVLLGVLGFGLNFLGHHDTESGHIPLLVAMGIGLIAPLMLRRPMPVPSGWARRRDVVPWRFCGALAAAWSVPLAALLAASVPLNHSWSRHGLVSSLINRCRFTAVPVDDIERLALWCQANTPATARFIGPPGPKTFRLWSRRCLAFNRAASPYHAAGLADWFARFQDHVDFHGSPIEFVRAYLADRHGFESRYHALSDAQHAALASRQGATYVVAAAPRGRPAALESRPANASLELLHVEGQYAVYRVCSAELVQRHR